MAQNSVKNIPQDGFFGILIQYYKIQFRPLGSRYRRLWRDWPANFSDASAAYVSIIEIKNIRHRVLSQTDHH